MKTLLMRWSNKMLCIDDKNFHNAWARSVRAVIRIGTDLTIGDRAEPKPIKDISPVIIELTKGAIGQIERRELHPKFPFRLIDQYCEEFTTDAPTDQFEYTYYDRLTNSSGINQLEVLRDGLNDQIITGISSNRNHGITWIPEIDAGHPSPPCLQRIWVRYIGNDEVEVHLTWRSRDLFTAWQANIIAIIDMLNREVILPNGCRIVKLVDVSNSLHIYKSDCNAAGYVEPVPTNPQDR